MAFKKKTKQKINKVTASQISGVSMRFIPETRQNSNHKTTSRTLVSDGIFWEEWGCVHLRSYPD